MRLKLIMLFFIPALAVAVPVGAQSFIPPFDFRMLLSGTFGELRSNHFHSGIDIKTGGVEGKPVRAIADGWVSRIKISPYGFGKAVYVDHASGHTSVYGHLHRLSGEIGRYAEQQQYARESFDIDVSVPRGLLSVSQGEIIALSGNSGSSGGPHLHFEIRDAATQDPLDPMMLGMDVKDFIRPTIKGLKIYPEGPGSTVNGQEVPLALPVAGWGPNHRVETRDTLRVRGAASFGLRTYDLLNDAGNHNGVYAIEGFIDGELFYAHSMDRFSFAETRYINAHIDYAEFIRTKARYHRTRVLPNNHLSIYQDVRNEGVVGPFSGTHQLRFVVRDHKGNTSVLELPVIFSQDGGGNLHKYHQRPSASYCLTWKEQNVVRQDGLELTVPGKALYDTVCITVHRSRGPASCYGPVFAIHNEYTPLHVSCELRLRADSLPPELAPKALIVKISDKGSLRDAGGIMENGWVITGIREFGIYGIAVDTIPPRLKSLNVSQGQKVGAKSILRFQIADNLSGISSYRGEVNGSWVLMEYDAKRDLLFYEVSEAHFQPGKNHLVVRVEDDKGNTSELGFDLIL